MDRRPQPATYSAGGSARPWAAESDYDDYEDEEWSDATVLTRGWAATRLVGLIIAVGLFAGITIGIALWLTLTALESSV